VSRYFAFRYRKSEDSVRQSLVLFCHSDIEVSSLIKEIKEDVTLNLVPSDVVILGFSISKETKADILSDNMFVDEFESFVGDIGEKITFLSVDESGRIANVVNNEAVEFQNRLMLAGGNEIFKNRKGVITSSPSYHFLKPSGDHCDKFIRASNLFTSGVEVSFLGISLLPYLTSNIKRVYVDTSSISFLISTAIQLTKRFHNQQPIIESFESYSVFKKPYGFVTSQDSLVVVSATTSGGLVKGLIKDTAFSSDNILTLFFSKIPNVQRGLFDISSAVEPGIYSVPEKHCKLCQQGSKVIKIEGEQFLPETPKHELLVIKKVDFDVKRQNFFKEFAVRGLLKFDSSPEGTWEKEHFYIDINTLLNSNPEKFQKTLQKKLNKHFARDISTVISLDDEGSKSLFTAIRTEINDEKINWLNFSDINEQELKDHPSVLVVAGAITSGRKLLATARKLRGIDTSATITYLVGFSKLPTVESFEQLEKDLCLGGHELVVLRQCPLPRLSDKSKSPWDIEKEKLSAFNGVEDPLSGVQETLPSILTERSQLLDSESTTNDDLFLKAATGEVLKLRNTFAFWVGLGLSTDKSSQADVYWTIQAILHDLRMKNDKGLATTYHSTLISPVCFDRFNDGVIQACLLRAAKAIELNYAVDEIYSRQITDIIISIVQNWDNPQGEACLEFLFALSSGQLKILDKHLKEVVEQEIERMSDDVLFLLKQLSLMLVD
jgi:hypothetical protein